MSVFQEKVKFKTVEVDNILDVRADYERGGPDELLRDELLLQLLVGHVNIWTVNSLGKLIPVSLAEPDSSTEFLLRDNFEDSTEIAEIEEGVTNTLGAPYITGRARFARTTHANPWGDLPGWPSMLVYEDSMVYFLKSAAPSGFNLTGQSWCVDMWLDMRKYNRGLSLYSTDRIYERGIQMRITRGIPDILEVKINDVEHFSLDITTGGIRDVFPLKEWRHVALCREFGVGYRIYINGELLGSFVGAEDTTSDDPYVYFATVGDQARRQETFIGRICQPRLTTGTALFTGSQITPPGPYQ